MRRGKTVCGLMWLSDYRRYEFKSKRFLFFCWLRILGSFTSPSSNIRQVSSHEERLARRTVSLEIRSIECFFSLPFFDDGRRSERGFFFFSTYPARKDDVCFYFFFFSCLIAIHYRSFGRALADDIFPLDDISFICESSLSYYFGGFFFQGGGGLRRRSARVFFFSSCKLYVLRRAAAIPGWYPFIYVCLAM